MPRRFLAILPILTIAASTAQATVGEIVGGPGGSHFEMRCASNEVVVGFSARAGAWVDQIGILCAATLRPDTFSGSRIARGRAGGGGGSPQEAYCPPGQAASSLSVTFTRGGGKPREFVNSIGVACQDRTTIRACVSSGEGCGPVKPTTRTPLGVVMIVKTHKFDTMSCPQGEHITGVHGRSGNAIDALGIICAPSPSGSAPRRVGKAVR